MSKKKNVNVNVEVNTPVEEVNGKVENEMAAVDEVENTPAVEGEQVTEDEQAGAVETISRTRRGHGQGSVYPLTSGKGFGYCIQLSADKGLRQLYGNRLRHLGTGRTYEETEAKCLDAISRKAELLAAKLKKLNPAAVE